MFEISDKTKLIVKCIEYYINSLTDSGNKCPSIEGMKEIVKLDEIKNSLTTPKDNK